MRKAFLGIRIIALLLAMVFLCTACSSGHWETEFISEYVEVPIENNQSTDNSVSGNEASSNVVSDTSSSLNGDTVTSSSDGVDVNLTEPGYLDASQYGIHNAFLTYVCKGNTTYPHTEEKFLPSVAYIENGQIKDTLFDTFIFLPNVNFVYDYGPDDDGRAPLKKSDWQGYMRMHQFSDGNMGALDSATGKMKQALNKPDYKTNVIMPMVSPVKSVTEFGVVDGKNLNLTNFEDRKLAAKWMVDAQIDEFNHHNYNNLKVVGFYWFIEGINSNDKETIELIKYITDYIRSIGHITLWLPYFYAGGYSVWKDFGFDLVAMQPNFFPSSSLPNAGGEERLKQTADAAKKYNMGVELECEYNTEASATNLKKYYRGGIEHGYINAFHAFYAQQGPSVFYDFFASEDPYMHSVYTDTYKFIKKTLKVEEMIIK